MLFRGGAGESAIACDAFDLLEQQPKTIEFTGDLRGRSLPVTSSIYASRLDLLEAQPGIKWAAGRASVSFFKRFGIHSEEGRPYRT